MPAQSLRARVTKVAGYEIVEKIVTGSTGTVYKGRDPLSGKFVAVKVLSGAFANHPIARMRFVQECKVARKLDHPHVARVLDHGLDGAKPYLVMEYVEGGSLGDRINREGKIPEVEAVRLIRQAGQALHWAHQRKLIHRDVKPDNILLTADGQAKLIDLGLVKDLDGEFHLTQDASCLGTPNFIAPEQFTDARDVDPLCDLYSLAATLYMAVTGELPFRGTSQNDLITVYDKKCNNDLVQPQKLVPELSTRVDAAILRGVRADPSERPSSILDFLDLLAEPAAAESPPPAPPAPPVKNCRRKQRYSSRRAASCRMFQRALDQTWDGKVMDISEGGLRIEMPRRFEPGSLLTVVLEGEKTKRQSLIVRVRWVKPLDDKVWQLGCELDQALCDFEVNELR
jgi:serine/threonine protein kinase